MKLIPKAHFAFLEYSNSISGFGETEYKSTLINFYRISSNRSPRLLLEPPGSPMNMILFKTPRFLVLYLLLQAKYPVGHTAVLLITQICTNDVMHHSATGNVQLAL